MRRKVPNVCRTKSKLNMGNIKNDKMSDIKKFYGWTERQLEQNVREVAGKDTPKSELQRLYKEAYGKKDI